MSDYTVTTDFSVKDALNSGDPNKLIQGSDMDTEFDAIAVAIATKPNEVASPVANNLIKQDASGHNIDADSISDNGSVVAIATGRTLNVVDNGGLYLAGSSVTSTAAELNILDGCTASAAELNLLVGKTGTVWTSTNDGSASGLDADLLDGQHGSYYRNASNINAGAIGAAYLPTATTSSIGALETATTAEVQALAASDKIVTPAGLGNMVGAVLLETQTASSAASIDFDNVFTANTGYDSFFIIGVFKPDTSTAGCAVRFTLDSGSTWVSTSNYNWSVHGVYLTTAFATGSVSGTYTQLTGTGSSQGIHTGSGSSFSFSATIPDLRSSYGYARIVGTGHHENASGQGVCSTFGGKVAHGVGGSYPIDGIQFLATTGNVSGDIKVYGVK